MISEEIVHINGIPKKAVIFLHGYQDTAEHIDYRTGILQTIDNVALHIPQAPFKNEIDPEKRQWYSIHRFDPEDRRRQVSSWEEFAEFYNRMTLGLEEANHYILQYADNLLNEYGLGYEDLFLCGFSQGAMCAVYSGLMCPYKVAGVVSFSGILAAKGFVEKHYRSKPEFLLIHGQEDVKVPFASLDFTAENIRSLGCQVETFAVSGAPHRIMEEGLDKTVAFIRQRILEERRAG